MIDKTSSWVMGVIAALFGAIALVMSARAVDVGIYLAGLIAFIAAVLFIFWLIKRSFDTGDASHMD
jgi:hypothetical protein